MEITLRADASINARRPLCNLPILQPTFALIDARTLPITTARYNSTVREAVLELAQWDFSPTLWREDASAGATWAKATMEKKSLQ